MQAIFHFSFYGDAWTPGRRARVVNMHMHSWDEFHRVAKAIREANIKPPDNDKPFWAGVSKTQEERAHSATINVAFKALRASFEAQDETRNHAPSADPDYRSSSIFVNNKAWVKLDTKEHRVTFLTEKIPLGLHHRLPNMAKEMEAAMRERER